MIEEILLQITLQLVIPSEAEESAKILRQAQDDEDKTEL